MFYQIDKDVLAFAIGDDDANACLLNKRGCGVL